ncbi:MAG: hypothetical protein ACR2KT_16740 [Methylocella sp.]
MIHPPVPWRPRSGWGANPFGVAVTPDGTHVYVTNSGSSNRSVIATATNKVVATVTVGLTPKGVPSP